MINICQTENVKIWYYTYLHDLRENYINTYIIFFCLFWIVGQTCGRRIYIYNIIHDWVKLSGHMETELID